MSNLTWGDGRTDSGCVLVGTQVIHQINSVEPLTQIDVLSWRSDKNLYIGKSSKMTHLVEGHAVSQFHWTGIDPQTYNQDNIEAYRLGLKLKYLFITPITERLNRKQQKNGVTVPLPTEGHLWTVPGNFVGNMFARRYINENGHQHFWILHLPSDPQNEFVMSPVATPSTAQIQRLDPAWHQIVRVSAPASKPVAPASIENLGSVISGNKVKVDLMVGQIHVTGTLEFNVAA